MKIKLRMSVAAVTQSNAYCEPLYDHVVLEFTINMFCISGKEKLIMNNEKPNETYSTTN